MAKKPKTGDRVVVTWLDIQADPIGEVEDADVWCAETEGRFVCWKKGKYGKVLVLSDTRGRDDKEFYGTTAFPAGAVVKVETI